MHYTKVKSILSSKNGMNLYRGCSHGCIYCDSRSTCYGMAHDFEDIEVKENASELLKQTLMRKRRKCMIGTGSMTDSYIHLESKLMHTRRCLEIIESLGFGLSINTKSNRILRDIDLLKSINEKSKCVVQMTLTTFDEELCKIIEPNVSTTKKRFEVLETLSKHNIPTIVWLTPILPYINDTEQNLFGILDYCIKANVKGIICFGFGLTLRDGNREYFYDSLDRYFPGLKNRYINEYGNSYEILSPNKIALNKIFMSVCQKNKIMTDINQIFKYLNTYESKEFEQFRF